MTDLSVVLLLTCLPFLQYSNLRLSGPLASIRRQYVFMTLMAVFSYLALTRNMLDLRPLDFNDKGVSVGAYQLYRLVQFGIVLFVHSSLTLSEQRLNRLRNVVGITLLLSCLGIAANYFGLIRTSDLSPHLPPDLSVSGPWAFYVRGNIGRAVGALSFHHAYPSVQVMLLAALYLHLMRCRNVSVEILVLAVTVLCSFVSGSRMGFIAAVLFAAFTFLNRPKYFALAIPVVMLVVGTCLAFDTDLSQLEPAIQRQSTITSSYETDGFAGRVEIWRQRLELLNQRPIYWLIGAGFGTAIDTGSNGHLLFLHVILECGLAGLLVFASTCFWTLRALWRRESGSKPLLCVSVALLVSGLTQETFYPVPALGHFVGLYLLAVSIALRNRVVIS